MTDKNRTSSGLDKAPREVWTNKQGTMLVHNPQDRWPSDVRWVPADIAETEKADAIREAVAAERERCAVKAYEACDYVARNYDVLSRDGTKYQPMRIQEIAKGFARMCREDAPAAIRKGDT